MTVAVLPGLVSAHHHAAGVSHLQQGVPDDVLEPWLLELRRMRPTDRVPGRAADLGAAAALGGDRAWWRCTAAGAAPRRAPSGSRQALRGFDEAGIRVAFAPGVADQNALVSVAGTGEERAFLDGLPPAAREAAEAMLPGPDSMRTGRVLRADGRALAGVRRAPEGRRLVRAAGAELGLGRFPGPDRGADGRPRSEHDRHPDARRGVAVREAVRAAHLRRVGGGPPEAAGRARAALLAGARRLDVRGRDRGAGRDRHGGEPQPELESRSCGRGCCRRGRW